MYLLQIALLILLVFIGAACNDKRPTKAENSTSLEYTSFSYNGWNVSYPKTDTNIVVGANNLTGDTIVITYAPVYAPAPQQPLTCFFGGGKALNNGCCPDLIDNALVCKNNQQCCPGVITRTISSAVDCPSKILKIVGTKLVCESAGEIRACPAYQGMLGDTYNCSMCGEGCLSGEVCSDENQCVCPAGNYIPDLPSPQVCMPSPGNSIQCLITEGVCSGCKDGYYLENGQCIINPIGCLTYNPARKRCTEVEAPYYSIDDEGVVRPIQCSDYRCGGKSCLNDYSTLDGDGECSQLCTGACIKDNTLVGDLACPYNIEPYMGDALGRVCTDGTNTWCPYFDPQTNMCSCIDVRSTQKCAKGT